MINTSRMKEWMGERWGTLLMGSSSPASVDLRALPEDHKARLDEDIIQETLRIMPRRGVYQEQGGG